MPKTTTALQTPLHEQLDRLAQFESCDAPVLSLYLDLSADQHGRRDHAAAFLKKVFTERGASLEGDARKSFDADVERIRTYIESDVPASVSGLAIFARMVSSRRSSWTPLSASPRCLSGTFPTCIHSRG